MKCLLIGTHIWEEYKNEIFMYYLKFQNLLKV